MVSNSNCDHRGPYEVGLMGENTPGNPYRPRKKMMCKILKGICTTLKVKQLRTSIYHLQMDYLVEHFNQKLKGMIWACIQGDSRGLDAMIPPLLFRIQEDPHVSTGYAPFELVYGQRPWGLPNLTYKGWLESGPGATNLCWEVINFREQLEKAQGITQDNLGKKQATQKQYYNAHASDWELQGGDWMLVFLPDNTHKLLSQWHGPSVS